MSLKFTKMHGLGNDFMVIDGINQRFKLSQSDIQKLSRRDVGVGFDQCLIVEASTTKNIDFFYRIFNANGTEVGQCGNGARCLALFLKHYQLTNKQNISVATKTTTMQLNILEGMMVAVAMGKPKYLPSDIPFISDINKNYYEINFKGQSLAFYTINVGNPHAVIDVTDVSTANVHNIGNFLSTHPLFPEGVNVGFIQRLNADSMRLRVFERGVGETNACGSGACAAAMIGYKHFSMHDDITVHLLGGPLYIHCHNDNITMRGSASFVYEGQLLSGAEK